MRVLHIAHYDKYPHEASTFFNQALNGLEQWMTDMIQYSKDEHYVLFFNHFEKSIFIQKILQDGRATVYRSYPGVEYEVTDLSVVFADIIFWLKMDLVHIHYLQDYIKDLPIILKKLAFHNIIVTMHDESYLGSDYGLANEIIYDERVASFIANASKIVFIHSITRDKFKTLYARELEGKTVIISNGIDKKFIPHPPKDSMKLRVLFLGTMHHVKGGDIVHKLCETEQQNLEFYLLGSIEQPAPFLTDCGRYSKKDLVDKVSDIMPDVIVIPSIAQETYSYTAAEATAMGIPIVCFNVGVLGEIEKEARGFVVSEINEHGLLQKLLEIQKIKCEQVETWDTILQKVKEVKQLVPQESIELYNQEYKSIVGITVFKEIEWEYVFEENLKEYKRKELLYLYKHHDYVTEKKKYDNLNSKIPKVIRKIFNKFKRMKEK